MKIGAFTFGGGYAMIALMENECVEKKKWLTHDELMNMTVIAESTPGPIALNCATYIGYQQAGFVGSILATISIVLPPFTIIYIISQFFNNLIEITIIANAFKGIKIAVGVLIISVSSKMFMKIQKRIFSLLIMGCSFITLLLINLFRFNFSTIYLILIFGLVGYMAFVIRQIRNKTKGNDI
jgi:chromate transporter